MDTDNLARHLGALWHSNKVIADLKLRHMLLGLGLGAVAALVGVIGLGLLELAAYFKLAEALSPFAAAFILGLLNFAIAATLVSLARRPLQTRELELANEIHGASIEGLQLEAHALQSDARELQSQLAGVVSQVSGAASQASSVFSQASGVVSQVSGAASQASDVVTRVTGVVRHPLHSVAPALILPMITGLIKGLKKRHAAAAEVAAANAAAAKAAATEAAVSETSTRETSTREAETSEAERRRASA